MGSDEHRDPPELGDESLDGVLRAVFEDEGDGESVLAAVGRMAGEAPRVLLRDGRVEPSPVLTAHARSGPEAVGDDARYQVLGEIARGGVGVVYKARDRDLGRSVALKVLRSEHADNPDVLERFVEEAQVEGQLQHPGVVPVYGLGMQPDGRPCFAMKLVRGETLAARLQGRAEPGEDRHGVLAVFESVCQAIAYAHARGVVHRDLKPANVMIGAHGEVQVMDWGFAKVLGREPRRPATESVAPTIVATVRTGSVGSESIAGSVMGTPAYMPPEQALGRVDELDERSDVFALGAILCEILTGRPPYAGEPEDLLVMAAHARQEGAHERLEACGADETLVDLTRRCLAPLRADRPRHAGEVAEAIHEFLAAAEERVRVAAVRAAAIRAEGAEETARLAAARLATETLEARAAEERAEAEREARLMAKEMRRGAAARRARIGIVAAAAGLALAAVLGGTGWLKAGQERAERAREIEARVSEAIRRAAELEGNGTLGPAAEAARAAVALAADAGEETRERAEEVVARIEAARDEAEVAEAQRRRDESMIRRLEEAWLARMADVDPRAAEEENPWEAARGWLDTETDDELLAVFREYGIDVEALAPDEAAARISRSAIRDDLVAALDEWALLPRRNGAVTGWERIDEVARAADPDPLRNELRDAALAWSWETLLALEDRIVRPGADPRILSRLGRVLRAGRYLAGDRRQDTLEAAIRVLRESVRRRPDDPRSHGALAGALYDMRLYAEAHSHFEAAVALQPGKLVFRTWLAWTLLQLGHEDRGLDEAHGILSVNDRVVDAYGLVSEVHRRRGAPDEEIRWLRKAVEIVPGSRTALTNLAKRLFALGHEEEAELRFREAVRVDPGVASHRWLAWCLWRQGKPGEALVHAQEAIHLDPDSWSTRCNLAFVYEDLREYAKAAALLRQALEEFPGHAYVRAWLAEALLADDQIDEAETVARVALEIDPEGREAWRILGSILVEKDELPEALEAFRRAVRADPSAAAFTSLGRMHDVLEDREKALACYEEAWRLGETEVRLANVTFDLRLVGRVDEAVSRCREALAHHPDWIAVRHRLAQGLEGQGHLDEALGECERALAEARETHRRAKLLLTRADILLERGSVRASMENLRRALETDALLGRGEINKMVPNTRAGNRRYLETFEPVVPFASRVEEIASGALAPADPAQAVTFGLLCAVKARHDAATRLFQRAYEHDPALLLGDERAWGWAAIAAVSTGTRAGRDQALAWLRAWLDSLPPVERASFVEVIQIRSLSRGVQRGRQFHPVRRDLERLPAAEREPWRTLWKDVEDLHRRALARKE